jgi:hypothetical protein
LDKLTASRVNPSDNDLTRARESLDEVKALTEYEDQKATRILTIVTIFGALAGLIFSRLAELYPLHPIIDQHGLLSFRFLLVFVTYTLFLFFVLFTIAGALVIFHATSIRFKTFTVPGTAGAGLNPPRSFLFFSEIIQVTPQSWAHSFFSEAARSFLTKGAAEGTREIRKDLALEYFRNYILESYLVAAKLADKLRYLMAAQQSLSWSIRILLLWLLCVAATFFLKPDRTKSVDPPSAASGIAPAPTAVPAPPSEAPTGNSPPSLGKPAVGPPTTAPGTPPSEAPAIGTQHP